MSHNGKWIDAMQVKCGSHSQELMLGLVGRMSTPTTARCSTSTQGRPTSSGWASQRVQFMIVWPILRFLLGVKDSTSRLGP